MDLERRLVAIGLPLMVAGCSTTPLVGDAGLVQPFSNERQTTLLPHDPPLTAAYQRRFKRLTFVGIEHTTNPQSASFAAIEKAFDTLQPRAVIVEGFATLWGPSPSFLLKSLDKPWEQRNSYERGEAFHAVTLAAGRQVPFWGGEPTDSELVDRLLAMGSASADVFAALMFGPLNQDWRSGAFLAPTGPDFEVSYARWAADIEQAFANPPPTDLASFQAWYLARFGKPIEADPEWATRGGPDGDSISERIGGQSNLLRDRHLFELMLKLTNERERVLTVFGSSHLANQWDALKASFGAPILR
ncbi:hypothetical protein D8I30_02545 [Brevundimonas naejangsanensis]|uniref:Uncharacterized protein n=1 Tax=Brevundimonas naejangsanensis TaxID=588932 RepID=A0A494RCX7_9CAUL|nr:hypothetical protein [Brevundimonas naejangsanensis]AYG94187.1 hypothetical protein D8I30_02545 [Brevundimonas naejangsanensis]